MPEPVTDASQSLLSSPSPTPPSPTSPSPPTPPLRRWRRLVWRLVGVAIGALLLLPLLFIVLRCGPFATPPNEPAVAVTNLTPNEHIRAGDQTYLTFPEWYIVFSADEYAIHLQDELPSRFPFFASVRQYWQGYAAVCAITRGTYEFNSGYHLMLYVIGVSFTVENGVKGLYEGSVGRLTEWLSGEGPLDLPPGVPTKEDALARRYAKAYGDFIHAIPWYGYPYLEELERLWIDSGWWGPNPVRKWERKLALSTEFLIKTAYGALIGWGTETTYGAVEMEIYTLATGVTAPMLTEFPALRLVEQIDDELALITIPHYQPFTDLVPQLAARGVRFKAFAGNEQVLLSAFVPDDWENNLAPAEVIFAMDALVAPGQQRVGLKVPVSALHAVLQAMAEQEIALEHIYDY